MRRATSWYYFIQTCDCVFQSTLSMRRATASFLTLSCNEIFQSTLSMRRATEHDATWQHRQCISIHALHEESDYATAIAQIQEQIISIHALHEESDLSNQQTMQLADIFQSTLSMRRATKTFAAKRYGIKISIHALHEESDLRAFRHMGERFHFNPRSP